MSNLTFSSRKFKKPLVETENQAPGLVEISVLIKESFMILLYEQLNSKIFSPQLIDGFVAKLLQDTQLSTHNLMCQLNIAAKRARLEEGSNFKLIDAALKEIFNSITNQNNQIVEMSSESMQVLLRIALMLALVSPGSSTDIALHKLLFSVGSIYQISGVLTPSGANQFLKSLEGVPGYFFAVDGAGSVPDPGFGFQKILSGKRLFNFDHHNLNDIEAPSTIEMMWSRLTFYLRLQILKKNIDIIDQINTLYDDKNQWINPLLCKILSKNSEKLDFKSLIDETQALIDFYQKTADWDSHNNDYDIIKKMIENPDSIHFVLSQPDPDSLGPISLHQIVVFWKKLFQNNDFHDISDLNSQIEFIKIFYTKYITDCTNVELKDLIKTGFSKSDLNLEIELLELNSESTNRKSIIEGQLRILLDFKDPYLIKYLAEIFSNANYDLPEEVSYNSINSNSSYLTQPEVRASFNRIHSSQELFRKAQAAKSEAEYKLKSFLKSDLFANTLNQFVEIYKLAKITSERLDTVGNDSLMELILEEVLSRMIRIIHVISMIDARGGIMPQIDTGGVNFEHQKPIGIESSPFGSLLALLSPEAQATGIADGSSEQTRIENLILFAVANHVHTVAKYLMDLYRQDKTMQSQALINLCVLEMFSLLLAFENNPNKFAATVADYLPLKPIEPSESEYYKIFHGHASFKVACYSQSEAPPDGMDRTKIKIGHNPGLFVICIGPNSNSKVGIYNFSVFLAENSHSGLMKAFLNFVSIFSTANYSSVDLGKILSTFDPEPSDPMNLNKEAAKNGLFLHAGSYGPTTGFRNIGVPFGQKEMENLVEIFVIYYSLETSIKTLTPSTREYLDIENKLREAIRSLVKWYNATVSKLQKLECFEV